MAERSGYIFALTLPVFIPGLFGGFSLNPLNSVIPFHGVRRGNKA